LEPLATFHAEHRSGEVGEIPALTRNCDRSISSVSQIALVLRRTTDAFHP
jgi:hypothetical protein